MKKRKADDNFIKQPYYEGGDKAMKEFIGTHLRYPDLSRNANTEGEVHLKYEIDYKGIVTDVKLIGGLDQYCNDEAIRVIRMLRFIVPKIPKHLKTLRSISEFMPGLPIFPLKKFIQKMTTTPLL